MRDKDRRNGLSPWAREMAQASHQLERTGKRFGFLGLCVLGLYVAMLLVAVLGSSCALGAEAGDSRIERLGPAGTCTFTGPIAEPVVTAICLTGLYSGQPIAAQVETGSADLAGWIVGSGQGRVIIALARLSAEPIQNAVVVVRVSLATPAPPHPCELPPPELMTMRDRCIAQACAAGIEPVCLMKTSAPGTGMPGAD